MTDNIKDTTKFHQLNILIVTIFIIFIEIIVLLSAFSQSGKKNFLQITDNSGQVIYEINGEHLSEFDKYYFENTFGPIDKFGKRISTRELDFPFRAWLTAAAGLPLFLILLIAFSIKAYKTIFIQDSSNNDPPDPDAELSKGFKGYIESLERLNIFIIGFMILSAVFLYWVIPNLFTFITKTSIDFIITYKWFFAGLACFISGMIIWITYLKYLLAKKGMDIQKEITLKQIELGVREKNHLLSARDIKMIEKTDSDVKSSDEVIQ